MLLNPNIIKMGQLLFDDATKCREQGQKESSGDIPMTYEDRYDLGDPVSWALALGVSTTDATDNERYGEDTLEGITGVNSLVDSISQIPWTNIDGNSVATTDPKMFPKHNIFYYEYDSSRPHGTRVTWKDFLAFRYVYKNEISLNDFTKEFHEGDVFIRHNETKLLFPLSIFEWRVDSINNKNIFNL